MSDTNGSGNGDTASVKFSVKELLSRMDGKLDTIDAKLNLKADQVEVEHLLLRIQKVELQVAKLDTKSAVTDALRGQIRWLIGLGVVLAAAIIGNAVVNYLQWLGGKHP